MTRTRMDVWTRTQDEGDWPEVLLAYARAVEVMRSLDPSTGKPTDPLSWQFQAAMHGRATRTGSADTQPLAVEPVPARQLVLPAVAPDVPRRLRGRRPAPPR